MRQIRLRLRSAILFILATLSLLFCVTIYTSVSTTNELDRQEQIREVPIPPGALPFWSAINHQNIYDLHATPANPIFPRQTNITPSQIDELYQLVRNARNEGNELADKEKLFPLDSKWDFQRLVHDKQQSEKEEQSKVNPENHVDTADSAAKRTTTTTTTTPNPAGTSTERALSDYDRKQLRHYMHQVLAVWKNKHEDEKLITLAEIVHEDLAREEPTKLNTSWYAYMTTVNNLRIYDPRTPEFQHLLKHLQNADIIEASEMAQGTQIKVIMDLPDGFEALFKPYRVPRNYQTLPDHFYFSDIERHHAEIAAFHVDRILGFYRVPPLIGRLVHITRDIRERASEELAKTFFTSPANNTCFRGHCSYYCDTSHAVCGKPGDRLEGSIQILLPRAPEVEWLKITHPYRRSYSAVRKAKWETNENYCYDRVFLDDEYHSRLLLDMMDLSAFDFLIGNMDRHHMMTIADLGVKASLVHLDNGRSFGRYDHDELSILAPIRQCCFFRYSTFARLYRVYRQGLSTLVSRSLQNGEKLKQILVDEHLRALDRRLEILFAHLNTCIKTYTVKGVMVDDGID